MIKELLAALRLPSHAGTIALPEGHCIIPTESFQMTPDLPRGTVAMESLASLVSYTLSHKGGGFHVFASLEKMRIDSVMDWHEPAINSELPHPKWGDHRANLALKFTQQWKNWTGICSKPLGQVAFAEFIEENLNEIIEPTPADVLTIATSLSGKRKVNFTNSTSLGNGDVSLQWEEQTDAKAAGDVRVPSRIKLAIPIFRGAEDETTFEIQALFRYRVSEGRLTFEIRLLHSDKVLDMAFAALVGVLRQNLDADKGESRVLIGSIAESPRSFTTNRTIK
jgi:uncharacterized protein YfdQ (DUF2303 family)